MNPNWTKDEWNTFFKNKIEELERQNQMLKTLQNLQSAQLTITKQLRKSIKTEITKIKLQTDDEKLETTTLLNPQN